MSAEPKEAVRPSVRRTLLRGCGCSTAFVIVLLAWAYAWITEPLDRSPLLGTRVASETESLLAEAAAATRARPMETGALRVGWASVPITPPLGTATYGYGARRGRGVTKIEDEVLANALAVAVGDGAPLVFLSADICMWVSDVSAQIAEEVRDVASRERIYFGATHNHSGPGGYADGPAAALMMGARDPAIIQLIVDGSARAIRAAVADLAPGGVREMSQSAPEYVRNRTPVKDPLDDELLLVEYRKADGRRCAFVSFSAHATAIGREALVCSGDYPGALLRGLRERGYDGGVFFASETGQAGPKLGDEGATRNDVTGAYALGAALAERVVAMSREAEAEYASEIGLSVLRSRIALPDYRFPQLGRVIEPGLAAKIIGQPSAIARVHAVRLGETIYVGHSFEFSAVIGKRLKERARAAGSRLVLTSFNGDHNLYVVPENAYGQGYESGMTLFGPGLGAYMERVTEQVYDCMLDLGRDASPTFDLSR
jgi:hypothetical protein